MHTWPGPVHGRFCVGSHWLPRFEVEPHTSYDPLDVDTCLQMGKSGVVQVLVPASSAHAM
jgi:hypothetical protein